jgi:hypothetical protein
MLAVNSFMAFAIVNKMVCKEEKAKAAAGGICLTWEDDEEIEIAEDTPQWIEVDKKTNTTIDKVVSDVV